MNLNESLLKLDNVLIKTMSTKKTVPKKTASKKAVKAKITKDMTLGELIEKFPSTVEILMKHGLHCVGCGVAYWETVEQGCLAHGMPKAKIEKMIKEMNSSLEKK